MKITPEKNPFIEIFQKQYEELHADPEFSRVTEFVGDLMQIDDDEIAEIFANELGNTWMLYAKKLQGGTNKIGAVCLKWDGNEGPGEVPTLVFADAYETYAIAELTEKSHVPGLIDSKEKIYARVQFQNKIFDEKGGFDIDFVTNLLFDVDDNLVELEVFKKVKMLYVIKTLDLAYRAVMLNIAADRFRKIPKNDPFAFFSIPELGGNPVLLCEISGVDIVH